MTATIKKAVADATGLLAHADLNEPRSEATQLLMHVIGRDRAYLLAHPEGSVSVDQMKIYRTLIERRATGHPLQYLTGHQEFFKLDFEVSEEVLIPRPETELIVEGALELLKPIPAPQFADVGTGSGCIAISLLNEMPNARGVALDASAPALAMARRNAERHGVLERLQLVESDLFSAVAPGRQFDVIVSNPPYIPTSDLPNLQREVLCEPLSALDGGADGLEVIRRLVEAAPQHLKTGGHLVFEIGFDQDQETRQLIDRGIWELIDFRKDLQGIPRTVVLRRRASLR